MAYLLDTCTVSELGKPRPDRKVRDALLALPREELHMSAITLGEIEYGIRLRPESAERSRLTEWLNVSVLAVFGERIVPVDSFVALCWGQLIAELKQRGMKMQLQDSLIAASAREFHLIIVTRNESDFAHAGVQVYNPWK